MVYIELVQRNGDEPTPVTTTTTDNSTIVALISQMPIFWFSNILFNAPWFTGAVFEFQTTPTATRGKNQIKDTLAYGMHSADDE